MPARGKNVRREGIWGGASGRSRRFAPPARSAAMTDERFWSRNFAWLDEEHSQYERAHVVVLPVPYDSTASGWVGSREGPAAIIEASGNMELYDIGTGSEPYRGGIHPLPELAALAGGPQAMVDRIEEVVEELLDGGKFVVTLGGEHTVAVGAVRAHAKRTPALSVLAFDAHADLPDSYIGSPYTHPRPPRPGGGGGGGPPGVRWGARPAKREAPPPTGGRGLPFSRPRQWRAAG